MAALIGTCVFCNGPTGESVSVEHIVPESLGNRSHVLPRGVVCDRCNSYFASKIELPLLASDFFTKLRARLFIPNKRGRVPAMEGVVHPLGIPAWVVQARGKPPFVRIEESDLDPFMRFISTRDEFSIYFHAESLEPNQRQMARLLLKMGYEALIAKVLPYPTGVAEIANNPGLIDLKSFVRYDKLPGRWPFNVRRIYDENQAFPSVDGGADQILNEYTLLYTPWRELFFVIAIFGLEFAVNLGGPEIEGYERWLRENSCRSPLY